MTLYSGRKMSVKNLVISIFIILGLFCNMPLDAQNTETAAGLAVLENVDSNRNSYQDYLMKYGYMPSPGESIILDSKNCITGQTENFNILPEFEGVRGAMRITGDETRVAWQFHVEKEGLYEISIHYFSLESKYPLIEFTLSIDGALPFEEANNLFLRRVWKNQGSLQSDSRGNIIRPNQVLAPVWMQYFLADPEGNYNDNLKFYFSKGDHVLEIEASRADFVIDNMELTNTNHLAAYEEVRPNYDIITGSGASGIIVQGEDAVLKSDSTLYPIYDRSDMVTSPSDPVRMLINTIGGYNWKDSGQWILWEFNVHEDGYYKISIRARQNLASGRASNRRIYIDDEGRFSELNNVKFPFSSHWYVKTLGDDEPYVFYLSKGTHTIKMEVVPGELGEIYNNLQSCVYLMNEIYRQIIMITGTTPDPYRDYRIHMDLPNLLDRFEMIKEMLTLQKEYMESISGGKGDIIGIIEALTAQLDSFIKKPDTIPLRLESYKANISTLSAWIMVVREQPLEIDYIGISPVDAEVTEKKYNIFQRFWFGIRALIGSFSGDYQMIGDFFDNREALTVWVGMGRDQAQIVKALVDDYFVKETGIKVNINLVQRGLTEATLAGKGPDICLFVTSSEPVNLAARGALVNLTGFDDFGEVSERFMSEALVPFEYEGGYYALPLTQSFPMMFCRTDIFAELGIEPPKTWDDIYRIAPVIQRRNMSLGIGGNAGINGVDIGTFATLLFQRGGRFYNDKRTATELNSKEALEAFSQWTDFFTKYSLPLEYDFMNRFRTGEMPIGIAPYTLYNYLQVAAPEIRNLWEMYPVPGTVREDGSVDSSVCGSEILGCVMFKKVKDKNAAWEFLKWFTSTETQSRFGNQLEIQMGSSARYPVANVEALQYLPWKKRELALLYKQWEQVREIPVTPANYFITRNITNAFRKVTYQYEHPWHTLNQYNYEMNKEIIRKREEFGLSVD